MDSLAERDINFLVSYRDREEVLSGFVKSVQKFYPLSKIIIAEQCDDKPFLQGQLLNLCFQNSVGDILVFMDVDIRFKEKLNIPKFVKMIDHPFIAYNDLWHCDNNGRILGVRKGCAGAFGGCCVFTRKQFQDSGGYSNLIVGWGADDSILNERVGGFERLIQIMLHVKHTRLKRDDTYAGNVHIYETDKNRNKHLDGFRQTTARLLREHINGNVLHLRFDNIGVTPDFAYPELVREQICL